MVFIIGLLCHVMDGPHRWMVPSTMHTKTGRNPVERRMWMKPAKIFTNRTLRKQKNPLKAG